MFDYNLLILKLNLWEKIVYGMGDVGLNLMFCIGILYFFKFYIDELGMFVYYGGIIFLVVKFFIVFIDMFIGFLFDLWKNIGFKGKFCFFILYVVVLVVLIVMFQFIVIIFCLLVKMMIVIVLFMMFGFLYSLMNCLYGVMILVIIKNLNECVQFVVYCQGGVIIGLLICIVVFILLQLFFFDLIVGYVCVVFMFFIGGFIFMMLCYRGVKEYYVDIMLIGYKVSIFKLFCVIFWNLLLLVLCIVNLCILVVFNIKLVIQVYYIQYVLNDINLLLWMGFFSMGCIFIGVLLVLLIVKCFGKKQVYLVGMVLWVVGDILNYFWGSNFFIFVMFFCVVFFGMVFVNSLNWVLVLDIVDYGEWKIGICVEGFVYIGYIFFCKIFVVFVGFLSGIMLM